LDFVRKFEERLQIGDVFRNLRLIQIDWKVKRQKWILLKTVFSHLRNVFCIVHYNFDFPKCQTFMKHVYYINVQSPNLDLKLGIGSKAIKM
jgi:hypothetical protein